jgi:adenylate cyclase
VGAPREPLGGFPGERKLVTLLHAALPPALGRGLDLDALHECLHGVETYIRRTVEPYGGVPQHLTPDHAVVLFGAPIAYEDHAQRAVLAAWALGQQWPAHAAALDQASEVGSSLGMGVHTGLVVVETAGASPAVPTAVVGDVPAVAAALAHRAMPGTILVSAATARRGEALAHLEALPPLAVAGQPAPMAAYCVVVLRPPLGLQAQRGERGWSPFTGREAELALLHSRWAQAQQGYGQVVGIAGEPGIGKTRLLREFRQHLAAPASPYLTGRCQSYGTATPYLPLLDLIRQQCGSTVTDDPEVCRAKVEARLQALGLAQEDCAPFLLDLLGVPSAREQETALSLQARKTGTFAALHQLFLEGSRQQPLILEIENLHWMDATSTDYLTELVERLGRAPLLLLLSYRPEYQPPWRSPSYATQIALTPLGHAASQRVLRAALGRTPLQTAVQQQFLAKAGGNPFFLEELAQMVKEQGEDPEALRVPDTIQAVLAARIDGLPAGAKRLLQTAAVIGTDVPVRLLQAVMVLQDDTLQAQLQQVQVAELLYETRLLPERTYTFKHVLTQEVAYQSLVRRVRQQLHGQIAEVLTASFSEVVATQPEVLAQHYTEAGLVAAAIVYWQRAGQRAMQHSAPREAISHLTTALEILQTLPDTAERTRQELDVQSTLGPAFMAHKGYAAPEVGQTYARAQALSQQLGETARLFAVLRGLSAFHVARGEHRQARELGRQLLSLGQRQPDPTRLLGAHQALGVSLFWLGELVAAQTHFEWALALYDPTQHRALAVRSGQDPRVVCLTHLACALWLLGYPDHARQRCQEALTWAQALSYPHSLAVALDFVALVHQLRRESDAVQQWTASVITLTTDQDLPFWLLGGMILRGWALAEQGQVAEGIAQIRQGLSAYQAMGSAVARSYFLALLAGAYRNGGQLREGLVTVAEALATVEDTGERFYEAELYRLKGELLLQSGGQYPESGSFTLHAAEAETCFRQALDTARHQHTKSLELRAATSLSRLWQQQGKRTETRQLLGEIYGWFTEGFDTADLQEAKALLDALA